jgi:hypothetical protein
MRFWNSSDNISLWIEYRGLAYPYNQNLIRFMTLRIVCAALRVSQIIGMLSSAAPTKSLSKPKNVSVCFKSTIVSARLPIRRLAPYIRCMDLQLSEEQADLLARELRAVIDGDRYFLSPRVRSLQAILDKFRPPRPREPLPPPRQYKPPRRGRYAKRR